MADGELYYLILEQMPLLGRERNSQAWLADFLSAVGMAATPTEAYARRSDLMLKVQPRWLDLPNAYLADLMAEHEGKTGKDLESALKQSIEDRFKYLSQPPTWLQAPAWPIKNGRPLVFVGQLDTTPIRHDSACLYVFYDADAGTFETVEQSA
jgi:hypothetical protein